MAGCSGGGRCSCWAAQLGRLNQASPKTTSGRIDVVPTRVIGEAYLQEAMIRVSRGPLLAFRRGEPRIHDLVDEPMPTVEKGVTRRRLLRT